MFNGLGSLQMCRDCFKAGFTYGRIDKRKRQSIFGEFLCVR